MRVTLTLQQARKIQRLDTADFELLMTLVKAGGIKEVTEYDLNNMGTLRGLNLVKSKRGKVWVSFAVNGVKPSPFLGHAPKKVATDPQRAVSIFCARFKKVYGKSYGTLIGLEWILVTRMCKEFDLTELEAMIKSFFQQNTFAKATVTAFYNTRNRLMREISQKECEHTNESEDESAEGGDWAAFDAASEGRDSSRISRRSARPKTSEKAGRVRI